VSNTHKKTLTGCCACCHATVGPALTYHPDRPGRPRPPASPSRCSGSDP
jgi:hypothetical protein